MYQVLFVCTGNICRTPVAEALLKNYVKKDRLHHIFKVVSAGTQAIKGIPPAENTEIICREHDLDVSNFRSNPITIELIKTSDIILCMAPHHKKDLIYIFPHFQNKIFTIKEFGNSDSKDTAISDPMGRSLQYYRTIFEQIEQEIKRIYPLLKKQALEKANISH